MPDLTDQKKYDQISQMGEEKSKDPKTLSFLKKKKQERKRKL